MSRTQRKPTGTAKHIANAILSDWRVVRYAEIIVTREGDRAKELEELTDWAGALIDEMLLLEGVRLPEDFQF